MSTESLILNGINGATGKYLFNVTPEEISRVARGEELDKEHFEKLKKRDERTREGKLVVKEGVDPLHLDEAGWGVIFAHGADPAIRDALKELLDHRKEQAAYQHEHRYQEYTGHRAYRPGDSAREFLARHNVTGVDAADPDKMPYYLLIVGDPQTIPYNFQYELDVQYAVGRIHFKTPEEYFQYARSVVKAEKEQSFLPRRAMFFGVKNQDDQATRLSADHLITPLVKDLPQELSKVLEDQPQWDIESLLEEKTTKDQLSQLLHSDQPPALLFTASHGMGFPKDDRRQLSDQGALLCQDWPGPLEWREPIPEKYYFSANDVSDDARLLGTMAFFFACYGAGTPLMDQFAHQAYQKSEPIAPHAFIAQLPQKLLSHPKGGPLAVVGHIERAWTYSFLWSDSGEQTRTFKDTLVRLMRGHPIGYALEYFNNRHGALSVRLSDVLKDIKFGKTVDDMDLASVWTANNDACGYIILGDPAVRLRVGSESTTKKPRPIIEPVKPQPPIKQKEPTVEPSPESTPPDESPEAPTLGPSPESAPPAESPEAAVDFGMLDSLKQTRASLTNALRQFSEKLTKTLDDVTSLEVTTYVSDDMAGVEYDYKSGQFTGKAKQRAWTRINLDGDIKNCVPEKKGEIDQDLWSIHLDMVKQAQANRAELVKTLSSLLDMLK